MKIGQPAIQLLAARVADVASVSGQGGAEAVDPASAIGGGQAAELTAATGLSPAETARLVGGYLFVAGGNPFAPGAPVPAGFDLGAALLDQPKDILAAVGYTASVLVGATARKLGDATGTRGGVIAGRLVAAAADVGGGLLHHARLASTIGALFEETAVALEVEPRPGLRAPILSDRAATEATLRALQDAVRADPHALDPIIAAASHLTSP
jgi:hypothetical protein